MNQDLTFPPDFGPEETEIIRRVLPYTMTSPERIFALIQAIKYIVKNRIRGDVVECGVWKGGSIMAVAMTLLKLNCREKTLYLFDTFEGMTQPEEWDVTYYGQPAKDILDQVRCYASLAEVESTVCGMGYDRSKIRFVKGRVEETIPDQAPDEISLLRLDTDWYMSTRHELNHLFPRLVQGGVIIIDDYGHWRGSQRATDEYVEQNDLPLLLHRIDYTGRIGIKVSASLLEGCRFE